MKIIIPLARQSQYATLAALATAVVAPALVIAAPMAFAAVAASVAVLAAYAMGERAAMADAALERQRRKPVDSQLGTAVAKPVATVAAATPAVAKHGSRDYWMQRLERDHGVIAKRVAAGEMSVYGGCLAAGIRKAPAKSAKWTKADAYLEKATA